MRELTLEKHLDLSAEAIALSPAPFSQPNWTPAESGSGRRAGTFRGSLAVETRPPACLRGTPRRGDERSGRYG